MKYLIMESSSRYAIALDEEGRFIKIANQGYQVGETIDSIIAYRRPDPIIHSFRRVISFTAAAASFILILSASWLWLLSSYGTVTMQINPSIKMYVNRINYVTRIDGLNEDGLSLIQGYHGFGKYVTRVSDELADRAREMNYLTDNGEITLEITSSHDRWQKDLETLITAELEHHLPSGISVRLSGHDTMYYDNSYQVIIPIGIPSDSETSSLTED